MTARLIILFLIFGSTASSAATCKIKIEDVNKRNTYTLEEKFDEGPAGRRKKFDAPGNDYECTLMFFSLKSGTMISCDFKKDGGKTFFQSDRSAIDEKNPRNKLSFRHGSSFISLDVSCE